MFKKLKKLFGGRQAGSASGVQIAPTIGQAEEFSSADSDPSALPFEVLTVPGSSAEATLRIRRRAGLVPVVFGDREAFGHVVEAFGAAEDSMQEIIDQGMSLDVDDWLRRRNEEDEELYEFGQDEADSEPGITSPLTAAREVGSDRFLPQVFVGLLPVAEPWHVPAYLKFGGWNECPYPHEHLALFKRWYDRYGSVITSCTGDVIEFEVSRPPQVRSEADALALEQFIYCSDIVLQGVGSVGNLSKTLLGSHNWFFWWD